MLLTAEAHKRHHTEFDCNFCIFNGWANPLVNQFRKLLTATGVYPVNPPTTQNRLDAAADAAAAKKLGNKSPMAEKPKAKKVAN